MNILFVWTGVAGYMGDNWRALASAPGVRLKVLIEEKRRLDAGFDHARNLRGLDCSVLYDDEALDQRALTKDVQAFEPGVIFIVGWRARLSRAVAFGAAFNQVPKVLVFDLPFEWSLKKIIAPVVLRPYLRHFQGCFVPGERAAEYARWLGFAGELAAKRRGLKKPGLGWIEKGLFCANVEKFSGVFQKRARAAPYPRQFLYVGRYAREKRMDVLVEAYRKYRREAAAAGNGGGQPWGLSCCGMGPMGRLLKSEAGVRDAGFVQPDDLPGIFSSHGAFVIASDHEPWGVVIAEAAAAGLPVICTEACGASLDVVRGNGIVCKPNDPDAIARAMLAVHKMSDVERLEMGKAGLELVKPFSCEAWAARVARIATETAFAQR